MSFVKWGVEMKPIGTAVAEMTIDGVPIRTYTNMVEDHKKLVGLVGRMLSCLDDERDASVIQEAHALLARIEGE